MHVLFCVFSAVMTDSTQESESSLSSGTSKLLIGHLKFCLFVCVEAQSLSQQYFSHVRTEPTLSGLTSTVGS